MFQKTYRDRSVAVKNTNWWSLSLDNLFLAGQIHYFLSDIFALHACSQDWIHETETLYLQDRDDIETLNPQDRDETRTFDFSKLSRLRRDRDVQSSRPRRDETFQKTSRDRLETETFKAETTSLVSNRVNQFFWPCNVVRRGLCY